jgi:hypothetical protein
MNILNLYFSATGNTKKVADVIAETSVVEEHSIKTVRIRKQMDSEINILDYDVVFAGSGVYEWLPGKPVISLFNKFAKTYREQGLIQQPAQRRGNRKAIIYCTYGGTHTGVNEAVPAVKYMGQLFDHLGFEIIGEWYIIGEFHGGFIDFSKNGKLGDITGRPDENDLRQISEQVKGILRIKF